MALEFREKRTSDLRQEGVNLIDCNFQHSLDTQEDYRLPRQPLFPQRDATREFTQPSGRFFPNNSADRVAGFGSLNDTRSSP